jgi:hypothetical protein
MGRRTNQKWTAQPVAGANDEERGHIPVPNRASLARSSSWLSSSLEMSFASVSKRRILAIAVAVVLLARLAAPTSPAGYWRGPVFDCLCSSDVTAPFSEGRVLIHHEPWDPTLTGSTADGGRYRRLGLHSFEWEQPKIRGGMFTSIVRPGWVFARYTDSQTREVSWAIREFNIRRL